MANDRSKTPTLRTHGETPKAKQASPFQTEETANDSPIAKRDGGSFNDDDVATNIFESGKYGTTPKASVPKPGEPDFVREPATPIRVKSMKTPGEVSSGQIPLPADARPVHQVRMRAISEVAKHASTPHQQQLGYLAPPRDHAQVAMRRWRDFVVWGSVCVMIACAIALGVWFAAK